MISLVVALLVHGVPLRPLDLLETVAVEQDHDDLLHSGVLGDEQALVLQLSNLQQLTIEIP